MACPDELLLSELLDNELDATERAAVAGHVQVCPSCRATLDSLRRADDAAAGAVAALTPSAAPAFHPPARRRPMCAYAAAVAAVALAGISLWLALRSGTTEVTPAHVVTPVPGPVAPVEPAPRAAAAVPAAEPPVWFRLDTLDESYEDFVKRISQPSRVPVDEMNAYEAEALRRELLLAKGIVPQSNVW
jgi:anti-sigma factor RsiW